MPPPRKTPVRERPRLDPLIPFIDAILTVDLTARVNNFETVGERI
jgi:hypothetical protein